MYYFKMLAIHQECDSLIITSQKFDLFFCHHILTNKLTCRFHTQNLEQNTFSKKKKNGSILTPEDF